MEAWLRTQGFTGITADSQLAYVRAAAPVSKINAAFHVRMKLYKSSTPVNAGPHALRANDRPVSLPTSVAGSVLGLTGLDNAAPLLPLETPGGTPASPGTQPAAAAAKQKYPCSHYYGQHVVKGLPKLFGTTTFPTLACGYSAGQLRAAYAMTSLSAGQGQTIALVELGLAKDMFLTLRDYAARNAMPVPSPQRYAELSLGRGTACGDLFAVEEQLDVEASYDMAPGANQLVVGGDSCDNGDYGNQGLFNADIAVLDGDGSHPLATVSSNSKGPSTSESQPAVLTTIMHAILIRTAAEGVGMYFASGDYSGLETPTDLTTSRSAAPRSGSGRPASGCSKLAGCCPSRARQLAVAQHGTTGDRQFPAPGRSSGINAGSSGINLRAPHS